MKTAQIRSVQMIAERYHRLADSTTGTSSASSLSVAKALDAAVIRWAESDGNDEPETEFDHRNHHLLRPRGRTMTAARLRTASALLRERATGATPGPWIENVLGSEGYDVRAENPDRPMRRIRVARCGYEAWEVDKANATYIALMSPPVALALADWLDATTATIARDTERLINDYGWLTNHPALAVADAILGDAAHHADNGAGGEG